MKNPSASSVAATQVYTLTRKGEAQISEAQTSLLPVALELLVRTDGKTTVGQLIAGMPERTPAQVEETLASLVRDGMLSLKSESPGDMLEFDAFSGFSAPLAPSPQALTSATREAAAGVGSLQQQGYYVRIALRRAKPRELPRDRKPLAVIVEDEAHLAQFLGHFMAFEGFDTRTAGDRAAVEAALRQAPRPDLILLDVVLPDADGFHILGKIRQHPALRTTPVIMLTAKATREAVIKGLAGGADGYITKPFQTEVLMKAIRTLFGISHKPDADIWTPHEV